MVELIITEKPNSAKKIAEALAALFVFVKHTNVLLRSNKVSVNDAQKIKAALFELDAVLGVIKKNEEKISIKSNLGLVNKLAFS